MAITLPPYSQANDLTATGIAAKIATANATFIASATVLINNAVNNGFYQIQPFVIPYLSISTVTTFFESYGYNVLFPSTFGCNCDGNAGYPYEPCFVAGFPEVLPPGYVPWNCQCNECGTPRVTISWNSITPPAAYSFLLLESGDVILLENGVDGILLETA